MAKRKNPETSLEAYRSLKPEDLAEIYRRIVLSLSALGMGSMEDIAAHMKVSRERVWKRLSELNKMGIIYRPGMKKVLRSGRSGYVWMLTNSSLPKTEMIEKALKGKSVADYSKEISNIRKQVEEQPKLFEF